VPDRLPLRVLPFSEDGFDWERFESFCLAMVRSLPDVRRAAKYGDAGEAQLGIDIEADLVDGRKRTVQCRHRKRFTRPDVEKTVAETTYPAAEREIWVTGKVSRTASDAVALLDGWNIESGEGIGLRLRLEVPRERARLIVADAFGPRVARAFLGPDTPIGFVGPDDFFEPFDRPDRLLRHDFPLVGRETELDAFVAAATDPLTPVVILTGRGGIGKSRLLRDGADRLARLGKRVLFASDPAALTAEVLEDLPLMDTVIVIDDAHRSDVPLAPVIASLRRTDPLAVVLSMRPGGLDRVAMVCADAGLEPTSVAELPRLKALAPEDVGILARHVLGSQPGRAQQVADATEELPLLTVLAGGLVARGAYAPDPSTGAEALRQSVMARFVAEQRGRVTSRVPEGQAQALMTLVAALSPLDTSDQALIDMVAAELAVPVSTVRRWLGEMQEAGLLLSRGAYRRLTPDVLADEVLFEACVDRQGRATGRALELWQRYSPYAASSLLANLAELEWRAPLSGNSLLDDIWSEISNQFAATDAWGREQMISMLSPSASRAPARVLSLVDTALSAPAAASDWGGLSITIDDDSVRQKLPVLLAGVGRNPQYARAALERLWVLGREDRRPTHSQPEHPLRVIRELCGYDFGPTHHDALLEFVTDTLRTSDADQYGVSPIELLDALLAREGLVTRSVGLGWQLGARFVSTDATEQWRQPIRLLLVEYALSGSRRQRIAAAALFDDALRIPHGVAGVSPSDAVRDEWRRDQMRLLHAVGEIVDGSDDPAVRVRLSRALAFHAEHEPWTDVQSKASTLHRRLTGPQEDLIGAIATPWDIHDPDEKAARDERAARVLLDECGDGRILVEKLEALVTETIEIGLSDSPDVDAVVSAVFRLAPAYASEVWSWSVSHPEAHIASNGPSALALLRRRGEDVSDELKRAGSSPDVAQRRLAASYLCRGTWFGSPSDVELEFLKRFSDDDDAQIRRVNSITLLRLRDQAPEIAVDEALRARVDANDGRSADMLFSTTVDYGVGRLNRDQVQLLAKQLTAVGEMEHFAHAALAALSQRDPELAVDIWIERVTREREAGQVRFRAVPLHDYGVELLGGAEGPARVALHSRLLQALRSMSRWRRRELGRLYWRLAIPGIRDDQPDPERLAANETQLGAAWEAIDEFASHQPGHLEAIGDILDEVPWQVLLVTPVKVSRLLELEAATQASDSKDIANALSGAASFGLHGRTVGEASPRWTETARQARSAVKLLGPATVGGKFFQQVELMAQRELDNDRTEDDDEREGWQ
jgi:hypothetical protein